MGVGREGFPEEVTLQLRAEEKQGARERAFWEESSA